MTRSHPDERRWPSLADDPGLGSVAPGSAARARVAIASYEFDGPIRNGGIGTACSAVARALAADGHDVELVFTGWLDDPSEETFEAHRRSYAADGIRLDRIDIESVRHYDGMLYNAAHALALYDLLRRRDSERPYDVLHFVESLGHGFYALAAKRQGLAFAGATTVVGAHSPRRWLAEAHGLPFDNLVEIGDEFLEQRSVELADVVVAPSAHMLDWMCARGFKPPQRSFVQQYVTSFEDTAEATGEKVRELVFFGRLELRKGIVAFCDALDELAAAGGPRDLSVTFLGKQVDLGKELSGTYLKRRARRWPWPVRVLDGLDRDGALGYLKGGGRLVVMPSKMDNSPNTVYEMLGLGVPFLAARTGGTGELVHPEDAERVTYAPGDSEREEIDPADLTATRPEQTGRPLAAALRRALAAQAGAPARFATTPSVNREVHIAWHRGAVAGGGPTAVPTAEPPPVSVCHASGSERAAAIAVAEHDLVLIVDNGIVALPEAATTLAAAAAKRPEADFLVPLGRFVELHPGGPVTRTYLPTGGPAVASLLGNCLGAGMVLARREALLGGLVPTVDARPSVETFELLACAALTGMRIEVVPEILFERSEDRAGDPPLSGVADPLRRLRPFHEHLPEGAGQLAAIVARQAGELWPARADAEAARAEADVTRRALDVVKRSRSWRMAGPLRRVAARARRWMRR